MLRELLRYPTGSQRDLSRSRPVTWNRHSYHGFPGRKRNYTKRLNHNSSQDIEVTFWMFGLIYKWHGQMFLACMGKEGTNNVAIAKVLRRHSIIVYIGLIHTCLNQV